LIDITLPKEEGTRLEFSGIETPQKNLYLKWVGGCKGAWKLGNAKITNLAQMKW
jgi:hypothetical protein